MVFLINAGVRNIISIQATFLERGRPVEERTADVERFWATGVLDTTSNVQFGEGGAGTFSDGKLTTGTHDPRISTVFRALVEAGAPADILYQHKPHIGTDILRDVVRNVRRELLFWEKEGEVFKIDSRTSDAIALAMRCGCPVYTTDEIMESEQLHEVGSTAFSVNVNTVDVVMLKEALSKAIEEENYEQASRLRDEIKRREQEEENTIA